MKSPTIVAAVLDFPTKRVFTGKHHYAAAQKAVRALHTSLEALIDRGMDEGFTVNGKYLTRYDVMARYGIDDAAQL